MSIQRAALALALMAVMAFAAFSSMSLGVRTAHADCLVTSPEASDPAPACNVAATENQMTISAVGSPVAVVGGSITFNISSTVANIPYKGFTWEVATQDSLANFTAF